MSTVTAVGAESAKADLSVVPAPDTPAALDFLERWRPGGPWVLTAIRQDKKGIETRTHADRAQAEAWLDQHNGQRNLYFHVNPTTRLLEKKAMAQPEPG